LAEIFIKSLFSNSVMGNLDFRQIMGVEVILEGYQVKISKFYRTKRFMIGYLSCHQVGPLTLVSITAVRLAIFR